MTKNNRKVKCLNQKFTTVSTTQGTIMPIGKIDDQLNVKNVGRQYFSFMLLTLKTATTIP